MDQRGQSPFKILFLNNLFCYRFTAWQEARQILLDNTRKLLCITLCSDPINCMIIISVLLTVILNYLSVYDEYLVTSKLKRES